MNTEEQNDLTKVHIDLPNHWWYKGESLWAKSLGNDLYEIRNIPFCAYGLNYEDVVVATADSPDLKPEIRSVSARSGNRTIRIFFPKEISRDDQVAHLTTLGELGTWYERANGQIVCLNVNADADHEAICDRLSQLAAEIELDYETCEERVSGSFDDLPEDEETEDA